MTKAGIQDRKDFFDLSLLIIDEEIGEVYDALKPYYDKISENSKFQKEKRIKELKKQSEIDQIAEIAGNSKRFELKFKFINSTNNLIYKNLIGEYFKFKNIRFCSLVADRFELMKKRSRINLDPWDIYINRAAILLANN